MTNAIVCALALAVAPPAATVDAQTIACGNAPSSSTIALSCTASVLAF
jgi:hypothetical protein